MLLPDLSFSSNLWTEPDRPPGTPPARYIGHKNIQEHKGTRCALCVEEKVSAVPQFTLPRTRVNQQGSTMCTHAYTPERSAVFYWNTNGSTFVRRVDGSAEYKAACGIVKKYVAGTYAQPVSIPNYIPDGVLMSKVVRSCVSEPYYEELFQLKHPLAATADEGLPDRARVRQPERKKVAVYVWSPIRRDYVVASS